MLSEFQRPIGSTGDPVWNKDYIYAFGKSFALIKNKMPGAPKRPWATPDGGSSDLSTGLLLHWLPVADPDVMAYVVEKPERTTLTGLPEPAVTVPASQLALSDTYSPSVAANCVTYVVRAMDDAGNVGEASPELEVCPFSEPETPSNVTAPRGIDRLRSDGIR